MMRRTQAKELYEPGEVVVVKVKVAASHSGDEANIDRLLPSCHTLHETRDAE